MHNWLHKYGIMAIWASSPLWKAGCSYSTRLLCLFSKPNLFCYIQYISFQLDYNPSIFILSFHFLVLLLHPSESAFLHNQHKARGTAGRWRCRPQALPWRQGAMGEAAIAWWAGACSFPDADFAPGGPWAVEAAPSTPWGRAVRDLPIVDMAVLSAETSGSRGVIVTPPICLEEDWHRQLEEGFVSQLHPCPQWHTECNWHTRSVPWPVTKKAERKILDSICLKPIPYLIGNSRGEWVHLIIQKKLRMTLHENNKSYQWVSPFSGPK